VLGKSATIDPTTTAAIPVWRPDFMSTIGAVMFPPFDSDSKVPCGTIDSTGPILELDSTAVKAVKLRMTFLSPPLAQYASTPCRESTKKPCAKSQSYNNYAPYNSYITVI
jgi:hypothetical protein